MIGIFLGRSRPSLIEAESGPHRFALRRPPFWGVRAPASLKPPPRRSIGRAGGAFLGRSRPSLIEASTPAAAAAAAIVLSGAFAPQPH